MVLKGLPVLYFANIYLNLLLISTGEIMLLSMVICWGLTFNTVLINCTPDRQRWGEALFKTSVRQPIFIAILLENIVTMKWIRVWQAFCVYILGLTGSVTSSSNSNSLH